jgi:hypothetical protein
MGTAEMRDRYFGLIDLSRALCSNQRRRLVVAGDVETRKYLQNGSKKYDGTRWRLDLNSPVQSAAYQATLPRRRRESAEASPPRRHGGR